MITIVYLLDIHMNNNTLYDWECYLKNNMIICWDILDEILAVAD